MEQKHAEYLYRFAESNDVAILQEFLYLAIFIPPGQPSPPRELLEHPEIRRYVSGWGQEHDRGVLAIEESGGTAVGAAWLRRLCGSERGYGYVDDKTPELTIAVRPEHRGKGVGTELMRRLLDIATQFYSAVSLSVDRLNPAMRLYSRLGFRVVMEQGEAVTMLWTPPLP